MLPGQNGTMSVEESVGSNLNVKDPKICVGLYEHKGFKSKCEYLIANPGCNCGGLFDHLSFFYCGCEKFTGVGYAFLALWLAALFYLSGNTVSDYFSCSLEKLSSLLKLPPTAARVSLLPLVNGPDVFASIAAFMGKVAGEVGLNRLLGGAVFVPRVVVWAVSFSVAEQRYILLPVHFDVPWHDFDCWGGRCWVAIAFVSIYGLYAFAVAAN